MWIFFLKSAKNIIRTETRKTQEPSAYQKAVVKKIPDSPALQNHGMVQRNFAEKF